MIGYVINLSRRPERKAQFLQWNAHQAIDFNFVQAIDGAKLSRMDLSQSGLMTEEDNLFTSGALGNALTHRALWEQCDKAGETALVFEDDACLRNDFSEQVRDALMRAGVNWDILFLGCNTNSPVIVQGRDFLRTVMIFDESAKTVIPDFFSFFSAGATNFGDTNVFDALLVWGTLGYVVSPKGARKLLESCFPLSSDHKVVMGTGVSNVRPRALDGMINAAMQRGDVSGKCCFPPLVLGPDDAAASDVTPQ